LGYLQDKTKIFKFQKPFGREQLNHMGNPLLTSSLARVAEAMFEIQNEAQGLNPEPWVTHWHCDRAKVLRSLIDSVHWTNLAKQLF